MPRAWMPAPKAPEGLFAATPDVPRFIVQALYNRNVTTPSAIRAFLSGEDDQERGNLSDLPDLDKAVERIGRAVADHESIVVYADFDVDGVCAAGVLMNVLSGAGAHAQLYIPRRDTEGYGLNHAAISGMHARGARLLICADCGTGNVAEIEHAHSLGIDVIVVDHHDTGSGLPPALAVINPQRPDSRYAYRDLAAVGVAYRLAQAMGSDDATDDVDLVALGTVVDVAPLTGENRALVRQGLRAMNATMRPGLSALLASARSSAQSVNAGVLAYALGPRLNAAGRMESACTSYDLLMAQSRADAECLAQKLEGQNLARQALLETAMLSAREDAEKQLASSPLLFVQSAEYHAGIIGLIASRLADEFGRPAVAVERGDITSRGSCRSIRGFHIAHALAQCADLVDRSGGHAMAAGFAVKTPLLPHLRQRLIDIAEKTLTRADLQRPLVVDDIIPMSDAGWQTLGWLERMEPFGVGNPAPLWQSNGVSVRDMRLLRQGHVRMSIRSGAVTWPAIAFRQARLAEIFRIGDVIDIVYSLEDRLWDGERMLQLELKDARKHTGRA